MERTELLPVYLGLCAYFFALPGTVDRFWRLSRKFLFLRGCITALRQIVRTLSAPDSNWTSFHASHRLPVLSSWLTSITYVMVTLCILFLKLYLKKSWTKVKFFFIVSLRLEAVRIETRGGRKEFARTLMAKGTVRRWTERYLSREFHSIAQFWPSTLSYTVAQMLCLYPLSWMCWIEENCLLKHVNDQAAVTR